MLQQELLKKVAETLESANIDYVLTGSVLSSFQGEPRSTHDIDILIIELKEEHIESLLRAFPGPDFYLDKESIEDAIKHKSMFNFIDVRDGNKVDFWFVSDNEFDQIRFARRYKETIDGISVYALKPEDTIIAKLQWAKLSGGSEKQLRDALRVYEVQYKNLDGAYLHLWTDKLQLHKEWKVILDNAITS